MLIEEKRSWEVLVSSVDGTPNMALKNTYFESSEESPQHALALVRQSIEDDARVLRNHLVWLEKQMQDMTVEIDRILAERE